MHVESTLQLATFRLDTNNADQLSLKNEHRVGRDRAHSSAAISPLRLNSQSALLARAHVEDSLVPSLDNLSLSNVEAQRLAAVV